VALQKGEIEVKRIFLSTSAGAMLLLISIPLSAQDDNVSMQQLNQCREIADTEERLACFDNISEPAATSEAAVETAAETPVETHTEAPAETLAAGAATAAAAATASPEAEAESEPEPDPDADFGLPTPEENRETIQANVVRCGEANNRKYYFYLDNGQIWEFLGRSNPRYRSCNSPVTVTEDGMGFSLQMEGDSSHRVRRYK
jgi:hypothetical protein